MMETTTEEGEFTLCDPYFKEDVKKMRQKRMEERDFVKEAFQNFKEDYNSLTDPTYCNINVGFGSLERGMNTVYDNYSIKIERNDFCFERIDGIIKRFIQMSSIPSMKGRRSMNHSNITIRVS